VKVGQERGAGTSAVSTANDILREKKGTGDSTSAAHEDARVVKRSRRNVAKTKYETRRTYVSNEELGAGVFEGNVTTI